MQDKEFDRLLKITRLRVSAEERAQIKSDFEQVIAYFDIRNSIESGQPLAFHADYGHKGSAFALSYSTSKGVIEAPLCLHP